MTVFGKEPAGYIKLADKFYIAQHKKPCLWHRFWMRVLLGWKWHGGNVIGGEDE